MGFLQTKWLFTLPVSSVSSCVYPGLREHWGPASRAPRFLRGHAMLPPGTIAQSVLAFGTRSWNVCIRKQLGWRACRTPPEFLRPVTFSSRFPEMITAWSS